jgi:hypothetical protein
MLSGVRSFSRAAAIGFTRLRGTVPVIVCGVAFTALPASAQQTWTTGTAGVTDGSGTWSSSGGTNWFNGSTYGAWASGTGVIGGGSGSPGTITISGTVGATSLSIRKNYLITGGTLNINSTAGTDVTNGVSGTIASFLKMNSVSSQVTLISSTGGSLTLAGGYDFGSNQAVITGSVIQVGGSGTSGATGAALRFGSGGSFTITGGTLAVGPNGRLANSAPSNFQEINGGVVRYSTTTQTNNVGNGLQLRLLSGEMAANNLTLHSSGAGAVGAGGVFILGGGTYRPATVNASLGSATSGSNFSITVNGLSSVLSGLDTTGTSRTLDVYAHLTGTGGITYTSGTVTLQSGSNTYSGPTTVSAATRLVLASSGALASSSAIQTDGTFDLTAKSSGITFGNGQLLSGTGSILMPSATVGVSGTLSPGGGSIGTLTFANAGILDISSAVGGANTGRLLFGLGSNQATSDLVSLTSGTLAIGSGVLAFGDFAFSPTGLQTGTYTLFSAVGGITGTLVSDTSARTGSLGGNFTGTIRQTSNAIELVVVPEPATIVLAVSAVGFGGLLLRRRRRVR